MFAGAESADNEGVNEINTILSRAEFLSFINTTMSNRTAPYKRVKIGNLTNDAKTRIETISGVRIGDIDNQGIIHALKKAAHNLEPDDLLYAENVINTSTDINISSKKHKSNTVIIFNKNINGEITILTELHEKHKYLKVFDAWRQKKARRGTTAKKPSANALNESPRADTSLSTQSTEKSSGDNLGVCDFLTTLSKL
ncbi:MAG: hypothetical protein Ta2G_00120 [Termitinemataceae bacterium]|nr:MAG: hypothetical protein Ta2G_00120 [Termitinemataceae bacterium]